MSSDDSALRPVLLFVWTWYILFKILKKEPTTFREQTVLLSSGETAYFIWSDKRD
jgi:hypothetical protein